MPGRHCILLFAFALTVLSDSYGQDNLRDNLVPDSIILKFRIKEVTQNWVTDDGPNHIPLQTTTEFFDTTGRIIKRIYINYTYHRYEFDFSYHRKKNFVKVKRTCYDWNPFREKRKGDTIVTRSAEKYDLLTGVKYEMRRSSFYRFQPVLVMDTMGRVVQSSDTIKFGYDIARYRYDESGNLCETRHFVTRFSEEAELDRVYSYSYDGTGQITHMILWTGYNRKDGFQMPNEEVETEYRYNDQGLLIEKLITTSPLWKKNHVPRTSVYRYGYSFH